MDEKKITAKMVEKGNGRSKCNIKNKLEKGNRKMQEVNSYNNKKKRIMTKVELLNGF
jgi:hypothetical protein